MCNRVNFYENAIVINGLKNYVCSCEAVGLSKVWAEYAENWAGDDIEAVGFNENSGYVYISLWNGVQLGCCLGGRLEYIVYDEETETELFLNSWHEWREYDERKRTETENK